MKMLKVFAVAIMFVGLAGGCSGNKLVKAQEEFATKACACKDIACVKALQKEQAAWVAKNGAAVQSPAAFLSIPNCSTLLAFHSRSTQLGLWTSSRTAAIQSNLMRASSRWGVTLSPGCFSLGHAASFLRRISVLTWRFFLSLLMYTGVEPPAELGKVCCCHSPGPFRWAPRMVRTCLAARSDCSTNRTVNLWPGETHSTERLLLEVPQPSASSLLNCKTAGRLHRAPGQLRISTPGSGERSHSEVEGGGSV